MNTEKNILSCLINHIDSSVELKLQTKAFQQFPVYYCRMAVDIFYAINTCGNNDLIVPHTIDEIYALEKSTIGTCVFEIHLKKSLPMMSDVDYICISRSIELQLCKCWNIDLKTFRERYKLQCVGSELFLRY